MEKKQKTIKNILLFLQVINLTIVIVMFARYAFNKRVEINYLFLSIIFVISLLELIYLKINLKKENVKRKIIILVLTFFIQVIVIYCTPIYTCYLYDVRDRKMESINLNGKKYNHPGIISPVEPNMKNAYGIDIL